MWCVEMNEKKTAGWLLMWANGIHFGSGSETFKNRVMLQTLIIDKKLVCQCTKLYKKSFGCDWFKITHMKDFENKL